MEKEKENIKVINAEFVIFEENISKFIKVNVNQACRNILSVLDVSDVSEEKRKILRKVILDEINGLGLKFDRVIENIGK